MKNIFNILFLILIFGVQPVSAQTYPSLAEVHGNIPTEELLMKLPPDAYIFDPNLILVNPMNPLESNLEFDAAIIDGNQKYNRAIQSEVMQLMEDAQKEGYELVVISAYRSIDHQASNRNVSIFQYIAQGFSQEEAARLTNEYIAPSNASEHTTGLVFDWLDKDWVAAGGTLEEAYETQPSAQWLAENAHKYGFILRYPRGKEHITTFKFEPWHFRYVGVEHATFMYQHDLVLEEYLRLLHEEDFRQTLPYRARTASEKVSSQLQTK